ncbi:hypothetical protein SARC_07868 [Sphaeroforma arctica JP610]|uniref:Uncharacterized protein n=1 Tax=Sphaeroforma arctica JP610 TaxID=667725 RepID=A0A0L0FT32_9EUKA|nr:hypothetical protein SARC_07868 [Sphaeroforma arctica JP610]KNC79741.1 hypothetical protein SARC_07868 [Sphaeroforma arctica JP610]|eukprot:XP_014153643.1 hypothetical protein SARC_07868 [Sphaeroforma arctica JP610]
MQIHGIYSNDKRRGLGILLKAKEYLRCIKAVKYKCDNRGIKAAEASDYYRAVLKAYFYENKDWWTWNQHEDLLLAFPPECDDFAVTFMETMATGEAKMHQLRHTKAALRKLYEIKNMQNRGLQFFVKHKAYKTCCNLLTSMPLAKRCNSEPELLDVLRLSQSRLGERLYKKHDNIKPNPKVKTLWKYIERMCWLRLSVLENTMPSFKLYRDYVLETWLNDTHPDWESWLAEKQFVSPQNLGVNVRSIILENTLQLVCVYAVLAAIEPIKSNHLQSNRTGPVLNKIVQKTEALQDIHRCGVPKLGADSPLLVRVDEALAFLQRNKYKQADILSSLLIG